MRNFFLAFIVFLLWSTFAIWYLTSSVSILDLNLFSDSEKIASETSQNPEETDAKPLKNKGIEANSPSNINEALLNSKKTLVLDESNDILFALDTLIIKKNIDSVFFKKAPENYFAPLISYLESNTNKEVIIHSDYSANEDFNTPNLGTARGTYIINMMSKLGVNTDKIRVKSNIKDIEFSDTVPYYGGISFQLKTLSESRLKEIEENRIITKIVYPTFTFSTIVVNEQFKKSVKELKALLDQYPDKKVEVIGHTDNIGSKADNYEMALKYARQARYYLIHKAGIPAEKVTVSSQGELSPIDLNTTKAGRENNRRLEFVIQ